MASWEFSWGNSMADFDNDGRPDVFLAGSFPPLDLIGPGLGDPGRLFFNGGDGHFPLSATFGLESEFSSGVATADYDNDGYPDIAVLTSTWSPEHLGRPRLFHNRGNRNHWLTVQTVGTAGNRNAIGARVTVTTGDGAQVQEVRAGSSCASMDSRRLSFGLGKFHEALVRVQWPSGRVERFLPAHADQLVTLVEGAGLPPQ